MLSSLSMFCWFRIILFLFLIQIVLPAFASLYPTSPISRTVWRGGHVENITWIDDGTFPELRDLGKVSIELYVAGNNHVKTLATGVHPKKGFHSVRVSPSWGRNGSDYHLRFITQHTAFAIYSADFTMTNMMGPDPSLLNTYGLLPLGSHSSATTKSAKSTSTYYQPPPHGTLRKLGPTLSLPNTVHTWSTPSSSSAPAPAPSDPSPSPMVPQQISAPNVNDAGGTATRRVDMEKLKFRLVFILWPAMIGLTMAL